ATESRIQLGINPDDIFGAWCALQTPVPTNQFTNADGGLETFYGCVPNWGTGPSGLPDGGPDAGPACALFPPDGGPAVPVGCDKIWLCGPQGGVCRCTAASCASGTVSPGTPLNQYPAELDATLDDTGTTLTGTLATPSGAHLNIHLMKQ